MAGVPAALTLRRQVLSFLSASSSFLGHPVPQVGNRQATCPRERPVEESQAEGSDSSERRPLPEVTKDSFFAKLRAIPSLGRAAGELLPRLFIAYALLTDDQTPAWAKAVAASTLAYFICPLDVLADAVPVIGLVDDALVVSIAFETLTKAVTPRVAERGRQLYEESDIKKRLGL